MFFYWPLAILAYAYVDSLDRLERFMKAIVYLSIPICLLGIYQFFQGPDFMIRVFGEGFRRAVVMTGGWHHEFLRVFGTFASSGQFTQFLVINIMFIFALLFSVTKGPERIIMIGCLVLNYISILCTGSRGGLLLLFPTAFLFAILCRWLWRSFFIAFLLAISLGFGFNYLGKAVVGRFETVKDVEMVRGRTIEGTVATFKMYLDEHPFGKGLGTGTLVSRHLYKESPTDIEFIETGPAKLQCELGIIGVVLFYLLLFNLFIHWIGNWLKFIDRRNQIFVAALSAYCWTIFGFALFGIIDNPPIGIFLWAEIGIVAKLATFQSDDQSDDQYPLST
jgi:hypothetical protein